MPPNLGFLATGLFSENIILRISPTLNIDDNDKYIPSGDSTAYNLKATVSPAKGKFVTNDKSGLKSHEIVEVMISCKHMIKVMGDVVPSLGDTVVIKSYEYRVATILNSNQYGYYKLIARKIEKD